MNVAYLYYAIGIVYFAICILNYLFNRKADRITNIQFSSDALANINNIKKLEQQEPSNKPPIILSIILFIFSFPLLALAGFAIWLWASDEIPFKFDLTMLLFALVFVILPLYVISDTFFIEPEPFNLGRSLAAKEANIDFGLDVDSAFDRCLNALTSIHSKVIKLESPKYIVALIDKSKFTISLKRGRGHKSKATIICDSQWVTARFDVGANRKFLNQFLRAL